jgi:hypothetical protein
MTTYAKTSTRRKIRGVGLGRLANAVGSYSSITENQTEKPRAFGAVFARGRAEGRGNQALLAYSEGASIFPRPGRQWLAFATSAIPKRAGRYKMTPARYRSTGLERSIGKLHFVKGRGKEAYLVARQVDVSRRTGIAKAAGNRQPRGSDRKKAVVAFVLIPFTRRAARFSQDAIMQDALRQFPKFANSFSPGRGVA